MVEVDERLVAALASLEAERRRTARDVLEPYRDVVQRLLDRRVTGRQIWSVMKAHGLGGVSESSFRRWLSERCVFRSGRGRRRRRAGVAQGGGVAGGVVAPPAGGGVCAPPGGEAVLTVVRGGGGEGGAAEGGGRMAAAVARARGAAVEAGAVSGGAGGRGGRRVPRIASDVV